MIGRLTAAWEGEYDAWRRRDLSARRYVYILADGVYLQAAWSQSQAEEWGYLVVDATRAKPTSVRPVD